MTMDRADDAVVNERLRAGRIRLLGRIRQRRALTRVGVIGSALLLAGSGVAASMAVAQASATSVGRSVVCYGYADLDSLSGISEMAAPIGAPQPALDLATKREMCELVWKSGMAVARANGGHWPDVDPNTSNLPVPSLAFCRLRDGMTGGFPIEAPNGTAAAVCDSLGLPLLG